MASDSKSSDSDDITEDQNPNSSPNPGLNPNSIDQSLDAIEDQLAAIALGKPNDSAVVERETSSSSEPDEEIFKDAPNSSFLDDETHLEGVSLDITEEVRPNSATEVVDENHLEGVSLDISEEEVRPNSTTEVVGENNLEGVSLDISEEVLPNSITEVVGENHLEGVSLDISEEVRPNSVEESSSVGFSWRRIDSDPEIDRPASPSSSGYAGERGSSGPSSVSGIDEVGETEIHEIGNGNGNGNGNYGEGSDAQAASWVPGKRHVDEDDGSVSWRKRKKHFIILSNSGKPIYSRYGDEHKLAGFSATLQAIISFVENGGDHIKSIRAGNHQVVFLVKGPIYLVCISCTEEPYESLRGQLELIYGQMILILTKSVNRCFEKNPKFDMTPLLGGTDAVFSSLIHSFGWNPSTFLHAYTCLPLPYPTRQAAGAILQDVADSGVLFAILMCKHKVVSLVGAQKASLHPDDMLLLSNFVMSSESFRTSESFSPICLPRYNPMAFLYAYVCYLDVDTYLMLLTTSSDAFYHLKDCRIHIEMVLLKSNVLSEAQRSLLEGGMHVEDLPVEPSPRTGSSSPRLGHHKVVSDSQDIFRETLVGIGGSAGLWHFMYRSIFLDQYVSSEFSSPINSSRQQKRLYIAYQKLYASMHDKDAGPHKTQFRRDENYVLLCWATPDFELYATFDPLADKAAAIKTCNRVCQWVKDVENEIFLLGASPFSW
ncbi:vacuolar fusion protein MON1 homolog [Impatiens glandulifera]|uniref:vacuolar fusion protein MON1 homolog n=1 Tax=Impatiens glandulifera TaxID=253017 RepID=UPI001FB14A2C|nr:vacuolar fusion protein MON1 homolog [Impatiens glandulifera]